MIYSLTNVLLTKLVWLFLGDSDIEMQGWWQVRCELAVNSLSLQLPIFCDLQYLVISEWMWSGETGMMCCLVHSGHCSCKGKLSSWIKLFLSTSQTWYNFGVFSVTLLKNKKNLPVRNLKPKFAALLKGVKALVLMSSVCDEILY